MLLTVNLMLFGILIFIIMILIVIIWRYCYVERSHYVPDDEAGTD